MASWERTVGMAFQRSARPRPQAAHAGTPTHGLQGLLFATFQAYRDTHLAHFNVTGPAFPQLHALFEDQYRELWEAVDTIAERVRALGPPVDGAAFAVEAHDLPADEQGMLRTLALAHRTIARMCQDVERDATAAGDSPTADLAITRRHAHEKHAWMLEATGGGRWVEAAPSGA